MQAIPAGCTKHYPWEDRDGEPVRYFQGAGAVIGEIDLHVEGIEYRSGEVVRVAVLNDVELSADQLRELMATCAAVLEEVER